MRIVHKSMLVLMIATVCLALLASGIIYNTSILSMSIVRDTGGANFIFLKLFLVFTLFGFILDMVFMLLVENILRRFKTLEANISRVMSKNSAATVSKESNPDSDKSSESADVPGDKNIEGKNTYSEVVDIIMGDDEISDFMKQMILLVSSVDKNNADKQILFKANPDTFIRVLSSGEVADYKLNSPFDNMGITAGKSITDIFSTDALEKITAAVLESEGKDFFATTEFQMEYSDAQRYIESRVMSIKNTGYIIVLRDITERKKMEIELLEKNKTLGRFNQFATARELKMIELKKENDALRNENKLLKQEMSH
jgi:hypothetical protein